MARIIHQNGKFAATTELGTVTRVVEYPNFVYRRSDGRTAIHPIGYGKRGEIIYIDVTAQGVEVWTPKKMLKRFAWE